MDISMIHGHSRKSWEIPIGNNSYNSVLIFFTTITVNIFSTIKISVHYDSWCSNNQRGVSIAQRVDSSMVANDLQSVLVMKHPQGIQDTPATSSRGNS
jgi:hypothetical protein